MARTTQDEIKIEVKKRDSGQGPVWTILIDNRVYLITRDETIARKYMRK
jgi:hypothetical protein